MPLISVKKLSKLNAPVLMTEPPKILMYSKDNPEVYCIQPNNLLLMNQCHFHLKNL